VAVPEGRQASRTRFPQTAPIGPYILDFYCAAAKLAVEVDGSVHDTPERIARDTRRTGWLAGKGLRVIRIRALSIRDNLDGVLDFIRHEAEARLGK